MSDSEKKVKASSVAAFLFMPQFHLCFQQFSFIVPVFIRTIAVMFVQAGLLPQGHPAVRYGMEGVKKYKFFELLGEAWYTLRANPSTTPFQWGLYAAVVMMVVFTILSTVVFLLNLSGMLVGSANAQIFDSPYGTPTSMNTVPGSTGQNVMFDQTIPVAGGGHGDYGIMVLDKILRQGAMGHGGILQNSLGSLMQIYNTGMLVIAGIMLAWAIIAVVLDTAKTGQIGGGRHNMVWAPIRIVVGLGLLIPLGASGFNSGQYLVMKLAEWGSNFGTRGWMKYVESVTGDSLVAKADPVNGSQLAGHYVSMWVCRVSYNSLNTQSGVSAPAQKIRQKFNGGRSDAGNITFAFTNDTNPNLCGMMTYATPNNPSIQQGLDQPVNSMEHKIAQGKKTAIETYSRLLISGAGPDNGTATAEARNLACLFAAQYIYGSNQPLTSVCPDLGDNTNAGPVPDRALMNSLSAKFDTAARAALNAVHSSINSYATGSGFRGEMANRGWAGMGMWYHKISAMNSAVSSVRAFPFSVTEGELSKEGPGKIMGGLGDRGSVDLEDFQSRKTRTIMSRYHTWWEDTASSSSAPTAATHDPTDPKSTDPNTAETKAPGIMSKALKIAAAAKSGDMLGSVTQAVLPDYNPFNFLWSDPAKQLYPMAMLTALGDRLIQYALGIYVTISAIGIVAAIFTQAAGVAFELSPLVALVTSVASAFFGAGVMLALWLPLLPMIRVAFGVLTWMIAIFEAVAMVPVAALVHISTEGEGIGGQVRGVWILWLNVLLRPILMVIGYVGAILIFNTFVVYFTDVFGKGIALLPPHGFGVNWISNIVNTVVYVGVLYLVANSSFKLIDLIPHAVAKYMGGHADTSFDQTQDASGMASAGGRAVGGAMSEGSGAMFKRGSQGKKPPGGGGGGPSISQGRNMETGRTAESEARPEGAPEGFTGNGPP